MNTNTTHTNTNDVLDRYQVVLDTYDIILDRCLAVLADRRIRLSKVGPEGLVFTEFAKIREAARFIDADGDGACLAWVRRGRPTL